MFKTLHSICHLLDSRRTATSLNLQHLKVFVVLLLLLVEDLLEIAVHVLSFPILELLLAFFDTTEASLHILNHRVNVGTHGVYSSVTR